MQKQAWTWTTPHFARPARMARWGHFGAPVLIFPTAGGDFEEIERFQLVASLASLIDGGRMKIYSVDALAVHARLSGTTPMDSAFDSFLCEDVLQRIRSDCQDQRIEPLLVGASLGAATALGTLFRHPDAFRGAIGLSGVYASPCSTNACASVTRDVTAMDAMATIDSVATLPDSGVEQLGSRSITLGTGAGDYENPTDSKHLADALGAKGIPVRFDDWGATRDHSWSTWRAHLPGLL